LIQSNKSQKAQFMGFLLSTRVRLELFVLVFAPRNVLVMLPKGKLGANGCKSAPKVCQNAPGISLLIYAF